MVEMQLPTCIVNESRLNCYYEHLAGQINAKYPKILHLADKHFSIIHEHLPFGDGELDFDLIFSNFLQYFDGRIILEITQSDQVLIEAKQKLLKIWESTT